MKELTRGIYTGVAWTPFLVILFALAIAFYAGLAQLELRSHGTSYIVPETPGTSWIGDASRDETIILVP